MTESEAIDGGWTKINSCEGKKWLNVCYHKGWTIQKRQDASLFGELVLVTLFTVFTFVMINIFLINPSRYTKPAVNFVGPSLNKTSPKANLQ